MDIEKEPWEKRLDHFHSLTKAQYIELMSALLKRTELRKQGMAILQNKYPQAPEEMLQSCAYHVFDELPDTLVRVLAWIELSLQAKDFGSHSGLIFDALYHLYNWLQFEEIVVWSKEEVYSELQELRKCIKENDKEGSEMLINKILEVFDVSMTPPQIDS